MGRPVRPFKNDPAGFFETQEKTFFDLKME